MSMIAINIIGKARKMPEQETSIYTDPRSEKGRLLHQAASLMPTVTIGQRGWILQTITQALIYYINQHTAKKA